MQVIVNGEHRTLPEGTSVASLIKELGLENSACAVEVNKRLVPKARHPELALADGDKIELVTLVGGG